MSISYEDNIEYAEHRLVRTVVRKKKNNDLVYISEISCVEMSNESNHVYSEKLVASVRDLNSGIVECIPLEDLELSSPTLGYVNYREHDGCSGGAYYVCRQPLREDWRQGLRKANLSVMANGRPYACFFNSLECLEQPIKNIYNTLEFCINTVTDADSEWESLAFSRSFSVDKYLAVHYKGRVVVGHTTPNGFVSLFDKYTWLKEALDERL